MTAPIPPALVLFGLPRSVYIRIARLVLEEKAVQYLLKEVEIFGSDGVPAAHWKRHPFGRIPVIRHGGLLVYETSTICRYVDEAFPGLSLQPKTPSTRARMVQIIGLLDSYAYRPMVWGAFVQRLRVPLTGGVADEKLVTTSLKQVRTALAAIAGLAEDSPFLAGPDLSLADLHACPMLRYFSLTPEGQEAIDEHPAVGKWLSRLGARASVQRTTTEYEQVVAGGDAA